VATVSHLAPIHLGLDVHKDTISVGILDPDQQVPDVERITHDEPSVRRLVARFPNPRLLRACYEAGPTGFELARLLHSMDVRCQVIAPSLIPRARRPSHRARPRTPLSAGQVFCRRSGRGRTPSPQTGRVESRSARTGAPGSAHWEWPPAGRSGRQARRP
jgi:hypothetical protein